MNLLRIILVIFCASLVTHSYAQDLITSRDFGAWTGLTLDFELGKKWEASVNQELRTFKNALQAKKSITEFGLSYEINKQFKLEGDLRYAYNREKNNTFSHNIRYNLDFKFKQKLASKLTFQYRFRYQSNFESPFTGFSDFRQRDKTRNRLKFDYKIKKHKVYLGTEIFREHVYYRRASFEKLRFTIGDKYKIGENELNFGLGYEVDVFEDISLNFLFARVYYTFKL